MEGHAREGACKRNSWLITSKTLRRYSLWVSGIGVFLLLCSKQQQKKTQLNMVATIFVQRMSKYQSEVKNELVWNCRPMYQCCQKVGGGCSVSSCSVPQSGFWHAKKIKKIKIKSQSSSELPLEWESITAVVTCYLIFLNCSSWFFHIYIGNVLWYCKMRNFLREICLFGEVCTIFISCTKFL